MKTLKYRYLRFGYAGLVSSAQPEQIRLSYKAWRRLERAHHERVDALTTAHLARRSRGNRHPVEDFLWTYYSVKPAELRRWHPGAGVILESGEEDRANWRFYSVRGDATPGGEQHGETWHSSAQSGIDAARHEDSQGHPSQPGSSQDDSQQIANPRIDPQTSDADRPAEPSDRGGQPGDALVDLEAFFEKRGATVNYVRQLLSATLEHTPQYGCFGLHEWAMVYRMTPEQLRHVALPLRIGHDATDRVVETNPISCTHFDAYRFFTEPAAPLNELRPTRDSQPEFEQSGCLHAGMDVYKWAAKLGPIVPGELLLDAFELARDIREVDMRASPYDVSAYFGADGSRLTAIKIETADGKREYAALQRGFASRGNALRERVLAAIDRATHAFAALPQPTTPGIVGTAVAASG